MKWRVEAIFTSRGFIEVEADSEEEAWEKAEDTDGGAYVDIPEYWGFEILKPEPIEERK